MTASGPDPTAGEAVQRALAAYELAVVRYRGAVRRRLNLSEEELSTLQQLALRGGVAQRRLAESTALSRSGAGAMLQRLEHDGLVERRTDPDDRRLRLVELSPAGRERIDAAYRDLADATDALLATHPPATIAALATLVGGLAEAITAAEEPDGTGGGVETDPGGPIWQRWA